MFTAEGRKNIYIKMDGEKITIEARLIKAI